MNQPARRHFHTFDALRFFAFFKVFLLHLPIYFFPWFNVFKTGGGIGVHFFFVLSGFLITYIICEEKTRTGEFNLKKFFARRILRIWPLYYLMVAVAYLLPWVINYFHLSTSGNGYEPNIWISATFLENYRVMYTRSIANSTLLSIMWTLCIEEHFYIVWGLLLYWLPIKRLPQLIGACIVIALITRCLCTFNGIPVSDLFGHFDLFALGAVPAYLLITQPEKVNSIIGGITSRTKKLFVAGLVALVVIASQYSGNDLVFIWLMLLLGTAFSFLILLTLPDKNALYVSDKNILSRMGVYTYGLYLYHILVILALVQVYKKLDWALSEPLHAISFIAAALLLTVLCSVASYHVFEKPFLRLKKYFR
jgi:peptidoglycan/LPS O-acetylase OafA/YrhL